MAKDAFATDDDNGDEPEKKEPAKKPATRRTRKPAAKKGGNTRAFSAKVKYQMVEGLLKEKDITEETTVAELMTFLKSKVFEEAMA